MSSTMPTRATSVRSAPATDRPGFVAATRPHLSWLYALARRLVGDPETAEDLVQRCLLQAHRSYGDLADLETLRAWLKQILVTCAKDLRRAEGRGPQERSWRGLDDDPLHPTSTADDPVAYSGGLRLDLLSGFHIDDLDAVLARLQAIYRVPLVLVHIEGYTTAEVADLLDTSQNTVLSRLHRGRQQFERQLSHYAHNRDLLADVDDSTDLIQPPRHVGCCGRAD